MDGVTGRGRDRKTGLDIIDKDALPFGLRETSKLCKRGHLTLNGYIDSW